MPKQRREPTRTCVACRETAGKRSLIRVVRKPEGGVGVDVSGRAAGRGAYVHADPACLEVARKRRALDRALSTTLDPGVWAQLAVESKRSEATAH